jgi:hypothetical protein
MRTPHGQFLGAVLLSCLFASTPVVADPLPPESTQFARVDWHQVAAPFGRFLLIRGAKGQCAVRFTEYHVVMTRSPRLSSVLARRVTTLHMSGPIRPTALVTLPTEMQPVAQVASARVPFGESAGSCFSQATRT